MEPAFRDGFILGLLIGEGHFGLNDGRAEVIIEMHSRHEPLLRWLGDQIPGSKLYGPRVRDGSPSFRWVARSTALREHLIPRLESLPFRELDPHAFSRYERMKSLSGLDGASASVAYPPAVPSIHHPIELARRFNLDDDVGFRLDDLLDALAAEPDPPTTIRDRADAIERHLADSLEALSIPGVREAARIADIGAGAGFPGLALAVALPDAEVDLIESVRRKCQVIERLAAAAEATRARAVPVRVEDWAVERGREHYDVVTARAVASLPVLLEYAAPLLVRGGTFIAWKGKPDTAEEGVAASVASILGLEGVGVRHVTPFEGARDRNLHVYRKVKSTPDWVPRRPGIALKRPLA
jgi:16S rRNA (guanine527-N7)-methyltransferase